MPKGGCDNATQGEMTQVDIRGCGGWAKIDCNGGCINIHKVLNSYLILLSLSGDLVVMLFRDFQAQLIWPTFRMNGPKLEL